MNRSFQQTHRPGNARFRALMDALEPRVCLSTTDPVIFNVTESARAGQVISVQGENFGTNPEIWLDRIVNGSDMPDAETQLTNVLAGNSQLVTAELPVGLTEGLYAVMVKNTSTGVTAAAKFINQARGLNFLDLGAPEVMPGQAFRIQGRNLDFGGSTTNVAFRNITNTALPNLAATVTQGSDPYLLQVTAPGGLVAGNVYEVVVNSGFGGTYGETTSAITLTARAANIDYWNTGTSWAPYELKFYGNVIDVGDFGAIPDDGIDDKAAIQAAINYASTSVVGGITGGVVQFEAGTYDVDGATPNANTAAIYMKGRVVLQGAGMDQTKILATTGGPGPLFSGNVARVGAVDLTVEAGPNANGNTWQVGGEDSWAQLLLRCRFINHKAQVLDKGSMKQLIDDCELLQLTTSGAAVMNYQNRDDLIVRDSFIRWGDGRVPLFTGSDASAGPIQLENNVWSRSVYSDGNGSGTGYGGPSLGRARNVVIIGNTFDKYDDPTDPNDQNLNIPTSNDGETIMNEDIDTDGHGQVVSSTDTTITMSVTYGSNKAGKEVTIIDGKGMGQTRKIVSGSGSTWTVDSPWDVNPDGSSAYAINSFDYNYLIKDNVLEDVPRGIWVTYGNAIRDVAIVDNQLLDANTIYLRGDARGGGRFNVQKNIVIDGNYLENSYNKDPAQIVVAHGAEGLGSLPGTAFFGVTIRNNTIALTGTAQSAGGFTSVDDGTGMAGDGYFVAGVGVTDNDTPSAFGVVLDHNRSVNLPTAYTVNTGSYHTVIFNSVNENVGQIVADKTSGGGTHASVNTLLDWTASATTPPFVAIDATGATASEGGAGGNFRFSRNGTSGNLVVHYAVSGTASSGDYTQTLTGNVTIPSGESFVDLPIDANDELVYFEPGETLRLTLVADAAYQIARPGSQVTIIDNDKTRKILDVGFNGTGGGTGGGSDIVSSGGQAALVQGNSPSLITVNSSNPLGGGNYATVNFQSGGGNAPAAVITPSTADQSWGALTSKPGSQWLVNGGFDFVVRRTNGSGSFRLVDIDTAAWDLIVSISGSGMRLRINGPGADLDVTTTGLSLNQLYHVGATLATDPGTGLVTVKLFKKSGSGAIDTTLATDLAATTTWNPDDTATTGFATGAFRLGMSQQYLDPGAADFDSFRLYNADPETFSDASGDSVVNVTATDPGAAEAGADTGTFTFTRSGNNTLKDLTVYYTLGGTSVSGDYGVSPTVGAVTIPAGQTSATVTITPVDDLANEGTESVTVNVLPDPMYVVGSTGATISIADDDATPLPAIIVNEVVNGSATVAGDFDGGEAIELLLTQDMTAAQLEGFWFGDSTTATSAKYHTARLQNMSGIAGTFEAGTLIVIGSTLVTQDTSYDPAGGDWNIVLRTTPPSGTDYVAQSGNDFTLGSTGDVVWVGSSNSGTGTIHSIGWETNTPGSLYNNATVKLGSSYNLPAGSLSFLGGAADLMNATWYKNAGDGISPTLGSANGGSNSSLIAILRL